MVAARAVVVIHRERMVAEGIASALSRYPSIVASAAGTPADVERLADRVDAVALDASLAGSDRWAARLRRRGLRVVLLGERTDRGAVSVPTREPVSVLAAALVPGLRDPTRSRPGLSKREEEILSLVARGFAGKQVAHHLGISPKTVERHKTRIFAKLGVANQAAAVGVAFGRHEFRSHSAWT